MNKKELIDFLEPFGDGIEIGFKDIDGNMAPHTYTPKYLPPDTDFPGRIVIEQTGMVFLNLTHTNQEIYDT